MDKYSRKIQGGKRSLLTPIPAPYIKKMGLEKGNTLSYMIWGDKLIFSETPQNQQKIIEETTINLSQIPPQELNPSTVRRIIDQIYTYGSKRVIITFKDTTMKKYDRLNHKVSKPILLSKFIEQLIQNFQEFEIIEQKTNKIIVQQTRPLDELGFRDAFNKLYYQMNINFQNIITGIKTKNKQMIEDAYHYDMDVITYTYRYCLRVLNQIGYQDYRSSMLLFYQVSLYEIMGDKFCEFAKTLLKMNLELPQKIVGHMEELLQIYTRFFEPFIEHTLNDMNEYLNAKYTLQHKLQFTAKTPLQAELQDQLYLCTSDMTHIIETFISKAWMGD